MTANEQGSSSSWAGPIALIDVDIVARPDLIEVSEAYTRALLIFRERGRVVERREVQVSAGSVSLEELGGVPSVTAYGSAKDDMQMAATTTPAATVVVCTRDRAAAAVATVASFQALDYPGSVEIIVVDNSAGDETLRTALAELPQADDHPVRLLIEAERGLSRARNRALAEATGEVIAFTDDDALVEAAWLQQMVQALYSAPDVIAVSGLTLPAELETQAQEWAELYNGLNKGRGLNREFYRWGELGGRHPLYPYPSIGTGVNMGFKVEPLRRLGGFCSALGVGTGTDGGDDTAIFAEVLLSRYAAVYEPTAIVRHYHRRDLAGLVKQMRGYGTGGTAYLTWCLHRHPVRSVGLVRMVPAVLRYLLSRGTAHDAADGRNAPAELLTEVRRGFVRGPGAYVRSARRERRLQRAVASHRADGMRVTPGSAGE